MAWSIVHWSQWSATTLRLRQVGHAWHQREAAIAFRHLFGVTASRRAQRDLHRRSTAFLLHTAIWASLFHWFDRMSLVYLIRFAAKHFVAVALSRSFSGWWAVVNVQRSRRAEKRRIFLHMTSCSLLRGWNAWISWVANRSLLMGMITKGRFLSGHCHAARGWMAWLFVFTEEHGKRALLQRSTRHIINRFLVRAFLQWQYQTMCH
eukprot:4850195-Prymnesium_polylepis.1